MPRLRRVSPTSPGLKRIRSGKGFRYVDAGGQPVSPETKARIEALVLPPAWEDVWICPVSSGHIQATGMDAAGRRQYRYHDHWRVTRDLAKHERILDVAEVLPKVREQVCQDLAGDGLTRTRVLSAAVRLLDLGFFRIGSEQYASQNHSYGLATMRKEHVTISRGGVVTFDYIAKSGKHRVQSVVEPEVAVVVQALKRRRGGGEELLAWRGERGWVDVKSSDINDHLRQLAGCDITAKDFRTWSATVLAAFGLAMSTGAESPTARKRAVTRVVQEVSHYLGNTPAVCRASYIDPRVIDLYDQGVTITTDLRLLGEDVAFGHPATQGRVESAVLALLRSPKAASAAS